MKYLKQSYAHYGKSRERLLAIYFESCPASLSIKDTEGRYVLINNALEQSWGVDCESLAKRPYSNLYFYNPVTAKKIRETDRQVVSTGHEISSSCGTSVSFPLWDDKHGEILGVGSVSTKCIHDDPSNEETSCTTCGSMGSYHNHHHIANFARCGPEKEDGLKVDENQKRQRNHEQQMQQLQLSEELVTSELRYRTIFQNLETPVREHEKPIDTLLIAINEAFVKYLESNTRIVKANA